MGVMDDSVRRWYEYHREDYSAVKDRLRMCRNIMLYGRMDAAVDMLEKGCVNAVLSIQTPKDRHERAFTAYYAADASVEKAAGMTVYGNQKARWLHDSLANANLSAVVDVLRKQGPKSAHQRLEHEFTGVSWVKAAFALGMCGVWELACPDSRTKQMLGVEGRIKTRTAYWDAVELIDDALSVDEPLFIKQWVLYDKYAEEHARHMPFFREALPNL